MAYAHAKTNIQKLKKNTS